MSIRSARLTNIGFTLVELLIAVSIIAILSGFLIPGFSNYTKNQNIIQAQEIVKSDLRTAQNKAITGVGSSTGVKYWGIKIPATNNATNYTFFNSVDTNCAGVTADSTSETLPGGVVIRNASGTCVFFSTRNGDASASTNFDLGYPDKTPTKRVQINTAGMIRSIDY